MDELFSILNVSGFLAANLIAVIGKSLVDFIKTPLEKRGHEVWYAGYCALLFGLFMVYIGNINMFSAEYFDGAVGIIITGLYAGGISVGIYDVEKKVRGNSEEKAE